MIASLDAWGSQVGNTLQTATWSPSFVMVGAL